MDYFLNGRSNEERKKKNFLFQRKVDREWVSRKTQDKKKREKQGVHDKGLTHLHPSNSLSLFYVGFGDYLRWAS